VIAARGPTIKFRAAPGRNTIKRGTYNLPRNIKLADPEFNILSSIDILIGAEVFLKLLCVGQIRASSEHPTLQKTQFGWILAGRLNDLPMTTYNVRSFHATLTNNQLHDQLSKFWDVEDPRIVPEFTKAEAFCENHFLANTSQDSYSRYTVKLPVNESLINQLGDSKSVALKRLRNLERRFCREPALKEQYARFISEYLALGHMKQVSESPNEHEQSYYLPHHCVFKGSGPSPKIRVVFDASCKSASGVSLNDALSVGPVVQQDLTSILLRFRTFAYVLVADIVKVYRQVLIHPTQTRLQRILWRDDPSLDVNIYELISHLRNVLGILLGHKMFKGFG